MVLSNCLAFLFSSHGTTCQIQIQILRCGMRKWTVFWIMLCLENNAVVKVISQPSVSSSHFHLTLYLLLTLLIDSSEEMLMQHNTPGKTYFLIMNFCICMVHLEQELPTSSGTADSSENLAKTVISTVRKQQFELSSILAFLFFLQLYLQPPRLIILFNYISFKP